MAMTIYVEHYTAFLHWGVAIIKVYIGLWLFLMWEEKVDVNEK